MADGLGFGQHLLGVVAPSIARHDVVADVAASLREGRRVAVAEGDVPM